MKKNNYIFALPLISIVGVAVGMQWVMSPPAEAKKPPTTDNTTKPSVLAVSLIKPEKTMVDGGIRASGRIQPWQEIKIGSEISGMLIKEVLVEVGAKVSKGQVLAHLDTERETVVKDQLKAQLEADKATLAQVKSEYDRTIAAQKLVSDASVFSKQDLQKIEASLVAAQSKVEISEAALAAQNLRLRQAVITAPDSGIISARLATPGQIAQGSEFFRLIRQAKFEWNAEVPVKAIEMLNTGNKVVVTLPSGAKIDGAIVRFSPLVSTATDTGLVYVSLPPAAALKGGSLATGIISAEKKEALVVPATAVIVKDGHFNVIKVASNGIATRTPVKAVLRADGSYIIEEGISEADQIVKSGAAFIETGDRVSIVKEPAK